MIAKSTSFHEAIRAGNEQCIVIQMPDAFTFLFNEDIAEGGISYTESVSTETNLTMGRAVQSEIALELINDGLLQEILLDGTIVACLGVKTSENALSITVPTGAAMVARTQRGQRIAISPSWSYAQIGGTQYPVDRPVYSMMGVEDYLYLLDETGAVVKLLYITSYGVYAVNFSGGESAFMKAKLAGLAGKRRCRMIAADRCRDYEMRNGRVYETVWEMAPLGKFEASKPEKVRTRIISLTAYDGMSKFEVSATPFIDSLTYPITMREMLTQLCTYCGVTEGGIELINGEKSFEDFPVYSDGLTCRQIVGWIAEANCTTARMNRYGELEMAWYAEAEYQLMRDDIYDLVVAEYSVDPIDKLQVHCTEEDVGVIIPQSDTTKTNYYEIMDNPMLYGRTDEDVRPWAQPIYERLIAFERYTPMSFEAESDWSIQAGDIITYETEDGTEGRFPVMSLTITWKGGTAKAAMSCTGEKTRGELTTSQRERIANGRTIHEFRVTLDEFESRIQTTEKSAAATYAQDEAPPSAKAGDLWVDTNDNNRLYRYNGSAWVDVTDKSVTVKTYAQETAPESANDGDLWISTGEGNKLYRYDGSSWVPYALDAGIDTYAQADAPASGVKTGDLWIDTDDDNAMYRWDGTGWAKVRDTHLDTLVNEHSTWIEQNSEKVELGAAAAGKVDALVEWQSEASEKITADAIVSTVRSSTAYTDDLSGKVNTTEIISTINQSAEQVKIQAPKIALEGIITANGNIKILEDGSIECTNGKFNGTVTSGNWTFDSSGSKYNDGYIRVNMTVLDGSFAGGDSSGTRAFYGSSNCDVQYGSDYDYTTYIRADLIKFIVHDGGGSGDYATAYCRRSSSGQFTFVCGESEDDDWSGNIGASGERWDYMYTNVLKAYDYPGSSSRAIKQEIAELEDTGEMLDSLTPVSFEYKRKPGDTRFGFIYEDTLETIPEICLDTGDGDPGIRYTDLIAPMVKEIQSLRRRVAALEQ